MLTLPENLGYNKSTYTYYKAYYTNQIAEEKTAGIIGFTTGYGPEIKLEVKPDSNTVREGQIVKMTATVTNTGDVNIENAKLKIEAPEGTVHTTKQTNQYVDSKEKTKTIEVGTIKPGEVVTKTYELKVTKEYTMTKLDENTINPDEPITFEPEYKFAGNKTIENIVKLSASNIENEAKSPASTFTVLEGNLSITNTTSTNETTYLKKGDKINYKISVENIAYMKELNNISLYITLPTGIDIKEITYTNEKGQSYNNKADNNNNNISISIESLPAYSTGTVTITGEINTFVGDLSPKVTALLGGSEEYVSNTITHHVETVKLAFEQNSLNNKYIKENTEYSYYFTIENTGNITSYRNQIELPIPEGLSFVKAQYNQNKETIVVNKETNGKASISIYELKPGEKITVEIKVKANLLPNKSEKQITTIASLEANGFEKIASNSLQVTIEYDENAHKNQENNSENPSDPSNPNNQEEQTSYYKITGTAWLDENKDGKRDETEELLSNIPVVLIYKSNNSVVKDEFTGEEKKTVTNSKGEYEFNNLKQGQYLVIFLHDSSLYSVSAYQAENVAQSENSDFISTSVILEGERKTAGLSNVIKITNSNVRDIDIGLYVSAKFDLKLDKYITKITLTTPTIGTKVYNYNNEKLAKIEVLSRNVNKSSIIVEYKIIVTNEGKIPGYVKKIIDYLPSSAKFNAEINKDWYYSEDKQNLYNNSLEKTLINPGESKEVKLILTYNITDKVIGSIVTNESEIYETYNEQGLTDMDSIEANKLSSEDDIARAEIILSVSTGTIIIYSSLIFGVTVILIIGIIIIKRRVFGREEE